jgi:hypothetical protein
MDYIAYGCIWLMQKLKPYRDESFAYKLHDIADQYTRRPTGQWSNSVFQVFEDGKPADCFHHYVDKSWNKSSFATFEEAVDYANNWLGISEPISFELDIPYMLYNTPFVIKKINKEEI